MHHAFQPQIQNLNSVQDTAVTFMSAPGENCELEDSILFPPNQLNNYYSTHILL